ncbi:hypothetical protein [Paraburkholderia sp. SIMBA_030]
MPLISSGLLNKQAAAVLGVTEYTVQVHRGHSASAKRSRRWHSTTN